MEKRNRRDRNSSVKGPIVKAVDFAGCAVSVTNLSTKATLDNKQMNGHSPITVQLYRSRTRIGFDLQATGSTGSVQTPVVSDEVLHWSAPSMEAYDIISGRTVPPMTSSLFLQRWVSATVSYSVLEHLLPTTALSRHSPKEPGAPGRCIRTFLCHLGQLRNPQNFSVCRQSHFTIC